MLIELKRAKRVFFRIGAVCRKNPPVYNNVGGFSSHTDLFNYPIVFDTRQKDYALACSQYSPRD